MQLNCSLRQSLFVVMKNQPLGLSLGLSMRRNICFAFARCTSIDDDWYYSVVSTKDRWWFRVGSYTTHELIDLCIVIQDLIISRFLDTDYKFSLVAISINLRYCFTGAFLRYFSNIDLITVLRSRTTDNQCFTIIWKYTQ